MSQPFFLSFVAANCLCSKDFLRMRKLLLPDGSTAMGSQRTGCMIDCADEKTGSANVTAVADAAARASFTTPRKAKTSSP